MWRLISALKMSTYHDASEFKVNNFCSKYNDNTSIVNLPNPYEQDDDDSF